MTTGLTLANLRGNGAPRLAAKTDKGILDVTAAGKALGLKVPADTDDLIQNGELRQSSNTSDFIFNTQQIISYCSKLFPLEPGDIIYTGTPEGVVLGMPKEKQVWLKPGDKVVTTIEKLGALEITVG
jgi:hypothetical protein